MEPDTAEPIESLHEPLRGLRDDDQFDGFLRRIVRAKVRRVVAGDVDGLAGLNALYMELNDAMGSAVCGLRAAGWSWSQIGTALNMSKQAAQQRFGRYAR